MELSSSPSVEGILCWASPSTLEGPLPLSPLDDVVWSDPASSSSPPPGGTTPPPPPPPPRRARMAMFTCRKPEGLLVKGHRGFEGDLVICMEGSQRISILSVIFSQTTRGGPRWRYSPAGNRGIVGKGH